MTTLASASEVKTNSADVSVVRFDYSDAFAVDEERTRHLPSGEVHVWLGMTDDDIELDSALASNVLTPDEMDRASKFRFAIDRRRWTQSRMMLRRILGSYSGQSARDVKIDAGDLEKPFLPDQPWLQFNLSHSENAVMVAVARDIAVGVDIEHINPAQAERSVARRVYSPHELHWLEKLGDDAWTTQFFRCWVRKEAYIKSTGEGMSADLQAITATPQPGTQPYSTNGWAISDLDAPDGFAAALAVRS